MLSVDCTNAAPSCNLKPVDACHHAVAMQIHYSLTFTSSTDRALPICRLVSDGLCEQIWLVHSVGNCGTLCITVAWLAGVLLCLYFAYRKRLMNDWETMRINGLKRRCAVPLLWDIFSHFVSSCCMLLLLHMTLVYTAPFHGIQIPMTDHVTIRLFETCVTCDSVPSHCHLCICCMQYCQMHYQWHFLIVAM